MRRSTPPVLWSCLLTGCTHAYGLDWSHHRLPYWAKFHLVLERISRCWDFEGISWSWNCHLFIIYGKVLLLLFSFCFHGLEKNPTFFFHALCVGPSILHHSACLFLFICCLLMISTLMGGEAVKAKEGIVEFNFNNFVRSWKLLTRSSISSPHAS